MIFLEGVGDVILPCAAAVVLPGLLAVLAAGGRAVGASVTFALTVGGVLWLRAGGFFTFPPDEWAVGVGFLLSAGLFLFRARWAAFGASVVAGAMAAWMWLPCVGSRLGAALTAATYDPWAALLPLVAYGVGLTSLPILVGTAIRGRSYVRERRMVGWASVGLGCLALVAFTGWYHEAAARLLQWSAQ